jgi:hypothetical protein
MSSLALSCAIHTIVVRLSWQSDFSEEKSKSIHDLTIDNFAVSSDRANVSQVFDRFENYGKSPRS